MKGYKATDENIQCRGYQFVPGQWHEHEGDLSLCGSGFHFCDYPSGPWCYYSEPGTRIWEVEADDVMENPIEPGAELKRVCRRIKLVREITPGGDENTGSRNTGDSNTGDSNTGDSNTGDSNTGDRNTGYRNTGDRNTGSSNTGSRNTGYSNTGDRNTGDSNATNFSSGCFCVEEPKVISFDVQTRLTREKYYEKYPESWQLGDLLLQNDPIPFSDFKRIPGITAKKLKALHKKHLEGRKQK